MDFLQTAKIVWRPSLWTTWVKVWRCAPVVSWLAGAQLLRQGSYRGAIGYYRKGLLKYPRHAAALYARLDSSMAYYRLGELEDAATELSLIIKDARAPREAFTLLADIHATFGEWREASRVLDDYRTQRESHIEIELQLVSSLLQSPRGYEELERIVSQLRRIRQELSPDSREFAQVEALLTRAIFLLGDSNTGERMLARLLALDCIPLEASLLRGELLLKQGRLLQAQVQLGRVIERTPRDPRAYALLAQTYLVNDQSWSPAWAKELAETACRLSAWRNAAHLEVLARSYEGLDDPTTSLLLLEKAQSCVSFTEHDVLKHSLPAQVQRLRSISRNERESDLS